MSQNESIPVKKCFFCQTTIGLRVTDSDKIATCIHDELEIIHVFSNDKIIHVSVLHRDLPFFCELHFSTKQYDIRIIGASRLLHQASFPVNLNDIQYQFSRLTKLLPFL